MDQQRISQVPEKRTYIIVNSKTIIPEGAENPSERGFWVGDSNVHLQKAKNARLMVSRLRFVRFLGYHLRDSE